MRFLRAYRPVVLLFIAALAAAIYTTYVAMNNIVAEQSRIQQQAISPVYTLVNEQLLKPLYIAQTFGNSIDFNQAINTSEVDEAKLISQLKMMEDNLNLIFFVASEKARKQYFSDGRTIDLVEGEVFWYFEALNQEKDIVADLGQVGDVHLFFDVKIYDENDEFLGFVGVGKRLEEFIETFQQYKQLYGYDFLFVNDKNEIILSSLPELVVTGEYIPKLDSQVWFKKSLAQKQSLDSLIVQLDEEDFLISEISIDELNWKLLLLVSLQARQAQITQSFLSNTIMALALVLVLFVSGFYLVMLYKRNLEKRVEIDTLSGLPNRSFIQRRFNQLRQRKSELCIIIMDLDHFKSINDTYGHNGGDFVIQQTAKILAEEVRRQDTVGRWGGEEFVMLIPTSNPEEGKLIAQRACQRLEHSDIEYEGKSIPVTGSFGISFGHSGQPFSKLLANADVALYEAKKNGRNRVEMYQEE